jgi:hypothetical protein
MIGRCQIFCFESVVFLVLSVAEVLDDLRLLV